MQRNSFWLGLLLGLLVPLVGMYMLYLLKFMSQQVSLADYVMMVKRNRYMIPKVLSLGMIAEIPLITYYKNRRKSSTLNGVFVAIMVYALVIVAYKFNVV